MRKTAFYSFVALCAFASLTSVADHHEAGKAREILKKADAKIKAIDAVAYDVTVEPGGMMLRRGGAAKGKGMMFGWNGGGPERFYAAAKTTRGDGQEVNVEGGGDGESFYLIDHTNKKAYEDMDPGVMGSSGRILNGMGMLEYVHNAPFDDEINAEVAEYQGMESIEGVECHKVRVEYAGGLGESIWYFGKDDYLPRRRVRLFERGGESGSLTITIANLEVNPKEDRSLYRLKLPKGYEQIDDFAP